MKRATRAHAALAVVTVSLAGGCEPAEPTLDLAAPPAETAPSSREGLLYGRVTTTAGVVYEGRLRWGGDQEGLWASYFNGFKDENPWIAYAPPRRRSVGVLGVEIAAWEAEADGRRPFMARLGDITRIRRSGRDILVTLKSGTEVVLDLMAADDLSDGLRVWDATRGVVDLREGDISTVELLPAPVLGTAPLPLHGTVRTRQGDFTGLIEWDRQACLTSDELLGVTSEERALTLRFDTIQSIARREEGGSLVTLLDGSEVRLSGTRQVDDGNRGVYVDDPRYGRVLVAWEAFERVDFTAGAVGPSYDDFPAGSPLVGTVTTRSGGRFAGRLVYDLDESETTETLDAPSEGLNYTVAFGLIASIERPATPELDGQTAAVTLRSGEALRLEPSGDLGPEHGGMLIIEEGQSPRYVSWTDVARIDFDPPTG
jgi:hypothetical protein